MSTHLHTLFELVDHQLDTCAKRIRQQVFAAYQDKDWSPQDYQTLQPLVRRELDDLAEGLFGLFDNVGGVLPPGIPGYSISVEVDDDIELTPTTPAIRDIHEGQTDLSESWRHFLARKQSSRSS